MRPPSRSVRSREHRSPIFALAIVVGLIVSSLFPLAARAAEPGLSPDLTWGTSSSDQVKTTAALSDLGSRWVRLNVEWRSTETSPGSYNASMLDYYDRAVDLARASGQRILMLVSRSPSWASGSTDREAPPKDPATFASFVHFLAARWAGKVEAWEVWNEPNISRFWPTGPNPAAYTALLRAAYPAIKSSDPGAKVVFAGPSTNDYSFVEGAYAAGAKGYFDVMSTHPYTCASPDSVSYVNGRMSKSSFLAYREIHNSMIARGDDKPIWFTEFGWSTTSEACGVSEATQAAYLRKAFQLAAQDRYVQVAFWYNLRNNYWDADKDTVEARYGLMRTDFSHKPSYDAFKSCAAGGCAVPAAPNPGSGTSINVAPLVTLKPVSASGSSSSLAFSAKASDDSAVVKVEFWLDRKLVATDTSAPYSHRWKLRRAARRKLAHGRHVVRAKAYDAEGLVGTDAVELKRPRASASASATRARTARRHGAAGRSHPALFAGRIHGAGSGRVTLALQRFRGGHWRKARALRVSVARSAFSRKVRLGRGLWRLRADYRGTGGERPSSSGPVKFHL
jgi:hypothetical protein